MAPWMTGNGGGHAGAARGDKDDDAWKQWWWQCNVCTYWNQSQKGKCTRCGCKKSFAKAGPGGTSTAAPDSSSWAPGPASPPTLGDYLWPALREFSGAPATQSAPTPPQPGLAAAAHQVASAVHAPDAQHERVDPSVPTSVDIKHAEAALKALPTTPIFADSRAALEAKIGAVKRAITLSKPQASQLATTVAALDRARKHLTAAGVTAQRAAEELSKAQGDVDSLSDELARLNAELGGPSAHRSDSLQGLADSFRAVLNDMVGSPVGRRTS